MIFLQTPECFEEGEWGRKGGEGGRAKNDG